MRILIIGSENPNALETYYRSAWEKMGHEVEVYPIRDKWKRQIHDRVVNRLGYRIFPDLFAGKTNGELMQFLGSRKFDITLVFKGMELKPETVRGLHEYTDCLAMYNPDHPFIYSGRGSGNHWMTASMGQYDIYFTYTEEIQHALEKAGIKSGVIPFGHALDEVDFEEIRDVPEIRKVCFVGSGDHLRADFLNRLMEEKLPIVVYGGGWKNWLSPEVEKHDAVTGIDFWRVMRQYRIQLNIMRPHNLHSHNMRTFEIPAAGGMQLAPRTRDHELFFTEDKEILLYEDAADCIEKCRLWLEKDDGVDQLRRKARERSLSSGYSYSDRAREMMEQLKFVES